MNILITGVSRGLGLAAARAVLRRGHSVYGISRTQTDDLRELQEDKNFFWRSVDLGSDINEVHRKVFKEFVTNQIPIHSFINNAAIAYDEIVTNLQLIPLERMFRTNVFSPMLLTKYVIRNMIYNQIKGSIIHVSSISVHTGYKGLSMYAASKGALEAFSKTTAREWGEKGIRSNALVAGFMETEMSSNLTNEQKDRIHKRTSLKKATDIDSVVNTMLFLAGGDAFAITGQNIFVDSGTI